jgi:hypothetical protein
MSIAGDTRLIVRWTGGSQPDRAADRPSDASTPHTRTRVTRSCLGLDRAEAVAAPGALDRTEQIGRRPADDLMQNEAWKPVILPLLHRHITQLGPLYAMMFSFFPEARRVNLGIEDRSF